jgi:hypothetical protein
LRAARDYRVQPSAVNARQRWSDGALEYWSNGRARS